ncbi:hypothetical protein SUGI_0664680 [Cryptomeria japonica]|nr:hypothetical protein SUGI_0664680 [Cryptomeria japonica]
MMVREVLNRNGEISVYYWTNDNSWSPIWFQPESSCGVYGVCGAYGVYFTRENIQSRRCMEGFHPRNAAAWSSQEWWSSGCVRRTPLNCAAMNRSVSGTTDGFLQVMEPTRRGCKTACLNNCSCAFTDSNSVVCKLWFGDLVSMRDKATSSDGQPLFIPLAASVVSHLSAQAGRSRSRVVALCISIPLGVAILSSLFIGRRNSDLSVQDSQRYFPTWAAVQIRKGNTISIVDERIAYKAYVEEVIRSVVISILCNPTMAQVVQILEGKSEGNVEKYKRCLQALIDDHCLYYKF